MNANNYLEHHGIKNQKWGVRHGPPYPLNANTHNKVVAKGQDPLKGSLTEEQKQQEILSSAGNIKRALHKLDKQQSKIALKRTKEILATEREIAKATEVGRKKGLDDKQTKKHIERTKEHARNRVITEQVLKYYESQTWKLLAAAVNAGYDIKHEYTYKYANVGKAIASGLFGQTGTTATGHMVQRNKFTVTKSEKEKGTITWPYLELATALARR